jgi:hypothetical protein
VSARVEDRLRRRGHSTLGPACASAKMAVQSQVKRLLYGDRCRSTLSIAFGTDRYGTGLLIPVAPVGCEADLRHCHVVGLAGADLRP